MSTAERQTKIRIVLVNTSHPGNIGGAARAMKNMGLAELYLVEPREYPAPRAVWRAAGASDDSLMQKLLAQWMRRLRIVVW